MPGRNVTVNHRNHRKGGNEVTMGDNKIRGATTTWLAKSSLRYSLQARVHAAHCNVPYSMHVVITLLRF